MCIRDSFFWVNCFVVNQPFTKNEWLIDNKAIDPEKVYHIMTTDFLLKGLDIEFLVADHPDIINIDRPVASDDADQRRDIRIAVINYLKSL